MLRRFAPLLLAAGLVAFAQKYDGPVPAKADLPYLKHASELVATEAGQAKEEKKKDDLIYTIEGAAASAKTPLASPIFIFKSDKIAPEKFGLFKLTVKGGHRELVMNAKKPQQPIRIEVSRLDKGLYRIEVSESLEAGEYSLSPDGSNQVFCFQVF
jgi:hypothetical protein